MTIHTTNSIVNDTDEPKWTSECSPVVERDDSTTTRRQNWRTWWSGPANERDCGLYLLNLLVGVVCLLVVIFLFAEICLDIKWLLS
jgi:hypothetical protein